MAGVEESRQLTNNQIVRLSRVISLTNMECIALGYLNFDEEILKSLRHEHKENPEAFNRDIFKKWAYTNSRPDQVQVGIYLIRMLPDVSPFLEHCKIAELLHYFQHLASLLYQAGKDGGYINPVNVEEILGVPWTQKETLGISPDEG